MSAAELDNIAAEALASMILEATADAVRDGGTHAADAIRMLANDAGVVLEIATGILLATSSLAGVLEATPEAIYAAALAFEPDGDDSAAVAAEAPDTGPAPRVDDVQDAATTPHLASAAPEGDPGPVVPEAPPLDLVSLTTAEQGTQCAWCACTAAARRDASPACLWHFDHGAGDPACPTCGVAKDTAPDAGEAT